MAETKVSPAKEESIILQEILNLLLSVRKKAFDRGMISQGQYIGEIASLQDIPNIIQRIKKKRANTHGSIGSDRRYLAGGGAAESPRAN